MSTQDGKLTGDLDAGLMSVLNDIKKELNDAKKLSSLSKSIDGNSSANAARTESNPTSSGVTRAAAPPLGSMPYASQPNPYARSELRTFQPEQPRPPQYQPSAPRPAASDALRSQASTNRQSMASSEESQDFAASLQKLRARLADVNTPTSNNTSSNQTPRTNASLFNSSPSLPTAPRASSNGQSSVEVPRDSPPPAPGMVKAKLPPGWEMKLDTASGKIFYVNHGLKAISWERPTDNWGAAKQQTTNQAPALRSELPSAASQPAGPNSARGRQDPRQSRASPPDPQPGVPLMAPPEPRPPLGAAQQARPAEAKDAGSGQGSGAGAGVMYDELGRQHRLERGVSTGAAGSGAGQGQEGSGATRAGHPPAAPRLSVPPSGQPPQPQPPRPSVGERARLYASAGGVAGQGGAARPGRMTESQFLQMAEAVGEQSGGQGARPLGSTFDAASALRQSSSNLDRDLHREQRPAPSSSQLLRTSLDPARFAKLEREMQQEAQQQQLRAQQRAGLGGEHVKDPTLQLLLTAGDRLQRHLNAGEPLPPRWNETAEESGKPQQHPRMAEYEFEAWIRQIRDIPRDEEEHPSPEPEPERQVPWQAKSSSAAMTHAAPPVVAAQSWQV